MTALVIAHRACPTREVENSIAGIRRGAELGADVVEVDVRRALDGVPVLHHDHTYWRIAKVPLPVRAVPSRLATRIRLPDGSTVPTLADALEEAASVGVRLALDTKDGGAAPAALEVVRAAGAEERVLLWSGHAQAVRYYSRHSQAQAALLRETFSPEAHSRFLDDAVACGAQAISANPGAVTEGFAADARERGLIIYAWFQTPDPPLDRLARVDGAVTDWPDRTRDLLEREDPT